jgi:hypothetical protein
MRTVVLVEGVSDRVAVETLAARLGRDLLRDDITVVPIGGAQAIGRVLRELDGVRVAGLVDAGEQDPWRRALGPEAAGLFVCDRDLEDELIRALGTDRVEQVIGEHGDAQPWRTFQKQAQWRGRPPGDQLRRFMGSGGSRKTRYAEYLVDALDLSRVPPPLAELIAYL